jgi:hypothetical protein
MTEEEICELYLNPDKGNNYISKDIIRKEIKKLNEKNGISFDMYTGQILKTKEDYQIAILKKLLRRK